MYIFLAFASACIFVLSTGTVLMSQAGKIHLFLRNKTYGNGSCEYWGMLIIILKISKLHSEDVQRYLIASLSCVMRTYRHDQVPLDCYHDGQTTSHTISRIYTQLCLLHPLWGWWQRVYAVTKTKRHLIINLLNHRKLLLFYDHKLRRMTWYFTILTRFCILNGAAWERCNAENEPNLKGKRICKQTNRTKNT